MVTFKPYKKDPRGGSIVNESGYRLGELGFVLSSHPLFGKNRKAKKNFWNARVRREIGKNDWDWIDTYDYEEAKMWLAEKMMEYHGSLIVL